MAQTQRSLQETVTSLSPAEVAEAAKRFFARQNSIYTAFVDMEGPGFLTLRGAGGEEVAIGATVREGVTYVTASTYLFDQQVARFLATLPSTDATGAHLVPQFLPGSAEPAMPRDAAV